MLKGSTITSKVPMEVIIGGSYYQATTWSKSRIPKLERFHLTNEFVFLRVIKRHDWTFQSK